MVRRRLLAIRVAQGSSITEAAKDLKIDYETALRWHKEPYVQNLVKTIADQQVRMAVIAPGSLAVRMFGVLENLEKDIEAAKTEGDFKAVMKGYEVSTRALDKLLELAVELQRVHDAQGEVSDNPQRKSVVVEDAMNLLEGGS